MNGPQEKVNELPQTKSEKEKKTHRKLLKCIGFLNSQLGIFLRNMLLVIIVLSLIGMFFNAFEGFKNRFNYSYENL